MSVKTLNDLFEHDLKDIYYAEHRLVEALEQLAGEVKSREIKKAFTTHKKETQGQIKRLQRVFKMFGEVPEAEKCPGIDGLMKEQQNFVKKEKPSQEILDYFNVCAAQKTEHYEISAYEGLIQIAQQLGMDDAIELLSQNLQEEQETLDKLTMLSAEYDLASLVPEDEEEEEEPAGRASKKKGGSKKSAAKKGAAKWSSTKRASSKKGTAAASAAKGRTSRNGSSRNVGARKATPRATGGRRETGTGSREESADIGGAMFSETEPRNEMIAQTDPATAV